MTRPVSMPVTRGGALPTLTSLRFFAALLVFGLHADALHRLDVAGGSGVSFFFVLSGFILTWSARDNDPPRSFWRRRAARIIPAYLVAWLLGIALIAHEQTVHWLDVLPGFVLLQAWFPQRAVHFGGDGVAWSLSCEALFYLCFPLLHAAMRRLSTKTLTYLLVAVLVLAVVIPGLAHSGSPDFFWVYVFPPTRMLEFVAGIAVGLLIRNGARCPVPLWVAALIAVIAYLAACFGPVWAAQVTITVVPYTLLIASAATDDLSPRRTLNWLRSRVLVTLGAWSYAFYLLHQLVFHELQDLAISSSRHVVVAVALLVTIAAAGLLYTVVEHPLERRLRAKPQPPETDNADSTLTLSQRS